MFAKYTDEQIREAAKLYETGLSAAEVAKITGISAGSLLYRLPKLGFELRPKGWKPRLSETTKICARCGKEKTVEKFRIYRYSKIDSRPLYGWCKACDRESRRYYDKRLLQRDPKHKYALRIKHRYGLTRTQYNAMLDEQGDACYICRKRAEDSPLVVDHDHKTGSVRKLLCRHCNLAIGYAVEDVEVLARMIVYLEQHMIK